MSSPISRRKMMQAMGAATLAPSAPARGATPHPQPPPDIVAGWFPEGPGTPKLSLFTSPQADAAEMRRLKQIGVNHVHTFWGRIPWKEDQIRSLIASFQSGGLTLGNIMIGGFPKTSYGRPGRDEEIDNVRQSIRAAGRAGLPVIEYNFLCPPPH